MNETETFKFKVQSSKFKVQSSKFKVQRLKASWKIKSPPLISGTGNGGQLRNGDLTALRVVIALSAGIGIGALIDILQRLDEFLQISSRGPIETAIGRRWRCWRYRRHRRHRRWRRWRRRCRSSDVGLGSKTQNPLVFRHACNENQTLRPKYCQNL